MLSPRALLYLGFNVLSVFLVVVANKTVFLLPWRHPYALSFAHASVTWLGCVCFKAAGVFEAKPTPKHKLLPLAILFVLYVLSGNLNLQHNTLTFYQITKLAIAPVVMLLEIMFQNAPLPSRSLLSSVLLVVGGIGVCTLTDPQISSSPIGMAVGALAVLSSAGYTVWVSKMQRELGLSSMQLLNEYAPLAVATISACVVVMEPLGLAADRDPSTLLGFTYTLRSVGWIGLSAILGLAVSLSTFLMIGATSALTYNVLGHVKTLVIVAGGVFLFGDTMSLQKAVGIACAMVGIVWFSALKSAESKAAAKSKSSQQLLSDPEKDSGKGKKTSELTAAALKMPVSKSLHRTSSHSDEIQAVPAGGANAYYSRGG